MAQLSRPYQIALGAIVVLAAVWFVALRGHSSTSGGGPSPAPSASAPAAKPAAPSSPYHGSAPGVAGLTRAIEQARGAVSASERNARQLERQSAEASSASPSSSSPSAPAGTVASRAAHRSSSRSHARHAVSRHATAPTRSAAHAHHAHVRPTSRNSVSVPAKQALVEGELKQGRTVVVLFWDPKGADDVAVRHELQTVQSQSTAVHVASAKEVGSFGSFTHAVQVYATPTMLIILPNGRTSTLTGFADAYAIRQAISEARER